MQPSIYSFKRQRGTRPLNSHRNEMASSSSVPPFSLATEDPKQNILRQVRSHEVAIAELNNLSSSRAVYQRNGNIFFCTSIKTATSLEQRQVDLFKAQLQKLNSA